MLRKSTTVQADSYTPYNTHEMLATNGEMPLAGNIHSIETMGAVDGPGLRFIAFMQGCPLRCQFCHNPDTWDSTAEPQFRWTPEQLLHEVLRYRSYIKKGGVTLSGGEPLLQARFVREFFRLAKENGLHTALDTSGAIYNNEARAVMDYTDLVLLDIKTADDTLHRDYIGADRTNNRRWFSYLKETGKPIWVRHVVVPGRTADEAHLRQTAAFLKDYLDIIERIELLPYHSLGRFKYEKLGIPYPLAGISDLSQTEIDRARQLFRQLLPSVAIR